MTRKMWLVLIIISALFVNTTTWGWPALIVLLVGAALYIIYKAVFG